MASPQFAAQGIETCVVAIGGVVPVGGFCSTAVIVAVCAVLALGVQLKYEYGQATL